MSSSSSRVGSLTFSALALLAAGAGSASAAPVLVSPSGVVDATADGRYLLLADASIFDRTTGKTVIEPTGQTPLDLAANAPTMLSRAADGTLYWFSAAGGLGSERVSYEENGGGLVKGGNAMLSGDGKTVLFTTTGPTPRIIEHDVASVTSRLRLANATLLDASEDGKVITFSRALPDITKPGTTYAIASKLVGYQVAGDAPRVVDQTRFAEVGTCSNGFSTQGSNPIDLQVSQDGPAGGKYVLTESAGKFTNSGVLSSEAFTRLDANGATVIGKTDGQSTSGGRVTTDPVSGAYVVITSARGASYVTSARLTADDGRSTALTAAPAELRAYSTFQWSVPFSRGAGAVSDVVTVRPPVTTLPELSGAWVDDALGKVGPSTTAWMTLPRAADPVAGPGVKNDATFVTCAPVAGAPADYAAVTLQTAGNSAGKVAVVITPSGKIAAKSVAATVSWYGLPVWSRTAKADGTLTLPSIPAGLPGFKLSVKITLADGSVLSESAALRRTR